MILESTNAVCRVWKMSRITIGCVTISELFIGRILIETPSLSGSHTHSRHRPPSHTCFGRDRRHRVRRLRLVGGHQRRRRRQRARRRRSVVRAPPRSAVPLPVANVARRGRGRGVGRRRCRRLGGGMGLAARSRSRSSRSSIGRHGGVAFAAQTGAHGVVKPDESLGTPRGRDRHFKEYQREIDPHLKHELRKDERVHVDAQRVGRHGRERQGR